MNKYWVSWYAVPKRLSANGNFELESPWWISGWRDSDGADTICAAIMAETENEAKEAIYKAYDKRPRNLEFRFCEKQTEDWSPFNSRFQRSAWMKWEEQP